jgi:Ca2+-binding RTX toxin-like protein
VAVLNLYSIFGDLGNDWLVGGTGKDHLYGGYGYDLLNVDDDHETNSGANDIADDHPSYEDRAFGGAGRDYIIGNTFGDRLIDWTGEFNSYIVPFNPFGIDTVCRNLQPALMDFLYDLSASDGADPTRADDTGEDSKRNGEPYGELGLVMQKDDDWKDQHGKPGDPQKKK